MDYTNADTTNTDQLRESVFNTINLINEIESPQEEQASYEQSVQSKQVEPTQSQNNSMSFYSSQNNSDDEVRLSDNFICGIKDKMLDPSKIEKIQNGTASTQDQLKYKINQEISQFKDIIQSQNNKINSLSSELGSFKQELARMNSMIVSQLNNISNTAQTVSNQQNKTQNQNIFQNQQQSQNQPMQKSFDNINQTVPQSKQSEPSQQEGNPRVGNFNSEDVSIEKYFYCGK